MESTSSIGARRATRRGGIPKYIRDIRQGPTASGSPYQHTGCGSVWLERVVWDHEAAGSNPVTPMFTLISEVRCLCGLRDFAILKNHPDFWLPLVTFFTFQ